MSAVLLDPVDTFNKYAPQDAKQGSLTILTARRNEYLRFLTYLGAGRLNRVTFTT